MYIVIRLFINLTPFIPLSLKGEGEEILERGKAPLLPAPSLLLIRKGNQEDRLLNNIHSNVWVVFLSNSSRLAIMEQSHLG